MLTDDPELGSVPAPPNTIVWGSEFGSTVTRAFHEHVVPVVEPLTGMNVPLATDGAMSEDRNVTVGTARTTLVPTQMISIRNVPISNTP